MWVDLFARARDCFQLLESQWANGPIYLAIGH
jgi:hypothetical protein